MAKTNNLEKIGPRQGGGFLPESAETFPGRDAMEFTADGKFSQSPSSVDYAWERPGAANAICSAGRGRTPQMSGATGTCVCLSLVFARSGAESTGAQRRETPESGVLRKQSGLLWATGGTPMPAQWLPGLRRARFVLCRRLSCDLL